LKDETICRVNSVINLFMILFGQGCKRTEEGQKEKIEGGSESATAESFEEEVYEEVGKIPRPQDEWGAVEEETLGE
jgi:hypothetical protein